jgi:hypothetical protein
MFLFFQLLVPKSCIALGPGVAATLLGGFILRLWSWNFRIFRLLWFKGVLATEFLLRFYGFKEFFCCDFVVSRFSYCWLFAVILWLHVTRSFFCCDWMILTIFGSFVGTWILAAKIFSVFKLK